MIAFIKKNFLNKQFILFVIIGGINTFNGSVLAFGFSLLVQANLAFALGYITALIIAYLLNSFFVFKSKLNMVKLVKFALSYVPNFIIQNIMVFIVYNILGLYALIAYILAAISGIPLTFLILKWFTFKNKNIV
ncbi:MAG: GtrA family protein [Defluviitaleaceae bacterium]|nr:GtrA family protein [Defluviitaleaceae bacterium]